MVPPIIQQFGDPILYTWPTEAWSIYLPEQFLLPDPGDISPAQAESSALEAPAAAYPDKTAQINDCVKQLRLSIIDGTRTYALTCSDSKGNEVFRCRVNASTGEILLTADHG